MKAAVMESDNGRSVILTDDGIFVEVEGSYEPGQIIEYSKWQPAVRARMRHVRNIAAAACLVMALMIGGLAMAGPAVFACVELGDEYCVRYLLDENHKVIGVQASENSGRELADRLDSGGVKGKDINEAIMMTEALTGISYDAAEEPPEVKCRNASDSKAIAADILEHYSETRSEPDSAGNKAAADRPAVDSGSRSEKTETNRKGTPDQVNTEAGPGTASGATEPSENMKTIINEMADDHANGNKSMESKIGSTEDCSPEGSLRTSAEKDPMEPHRPG